MKRTKVARKTLAAAILTADLHLTEFAPISRTDDYLAAQERKLGFLRTLSGENGGCPILCAGDVFDKWKTSPWFNAWVYKNLPPDMITIPGNHDLPMHSFTQYDKSALHLFERILKSDELSVLKNSTFSHGGLLVHGTPFGVEFAPCKRKEEGAAPSRRVLLLHTYVWQGRHRPSWAVSSYTDKEILQKFGKSFDLIVTGDNHESFTSRLGDTLLVNPGSMLRRTADQAEFQPQCFLYYADSNDVEAVPFPIEESVHNREHLDRKREHDERVSAYIERMALGWKGQLSFRDNLQEFFDANKTPKNVRDLIWEHLEAGEM